VEEEGRDAMIAKAAIKAVVNFCVKRMVKDNVCVEIVLWREKGEKKKDEKDEINGDMDLCPFL
jgi:hypothetical protein